TTIRTECHGLRDGACNRHARRGRDLLELGVETSDLLPILRGRRVQRRDRGLDLIWPRRPARERFVEKTYALVDLVSLPRRLVLILEHHDFSMRVGSGFAARVVQDHEREEAARLG